MKRCPRCGREYDNTLMFCLDDGAELLYGPANTDGPSTAIVLGEFPTKILPVNSISDAYAREFEEGFRVAVLPFKFQGTDAALPGLAAGMTQEIEKGLLLYSYLKVLSHSLSASIQNETVDIRNAGRALGARYIIDGTFRQSGAMARLSLQLNDSVTGDSLWAEKYDLILEPERVFDIQDNLTPQIVSTIADMHGVLARTMGERLRTKPVKDLTSYEALVRSFGYFYRVTPAEWRTSLDGVEKALEKAPEYSTLRAMRSLLLVQGYAQGFDLSEVGLEQGAIDARQAVGESSSDHLAWFAMAQALFFKKEFNSLQSAVARSLALNPMDGNATALFGEFISYAGDWTWGLQLAETARELNPNFPGWYWHVNFNDAYRRHNYRAAAGRRSKNEPKQQLGCPRFDGDRIRSTGRERTRH